MVTHDPVAAAVADVVVFLKDGRVTDRISLSRESDTRNAASIAAHMARLEA
jgi:putative ABC transport system ATP-binding protein